MKKIYLILFFLSLLITQCNSSSEEPTPVNDPESDVNIVSPINYGNNVFYFPCEQRDFALSLSQFLSDSTIEIEAMAGNGNAGYGSDQGYFVVIKRKN